MQFYDNTNKQGICQEIDRLCDTTDTTYSRVAKTSRVNNSLEELVGEIINSDGTWQYDDTNYSSLPIGIGNLVSGQISYSFASEYLQIEEVSILDKNGNYIRIQPFDSSEVGQTFEEYFGITFNGSTYTAVEAFPTFYDKLGDSIRLNSSPTAANVTLTNGIRVKFKRTASLFAVASDTSEDTQHPGLPSTHHVILAYMASIPYCMTYKKDRVALYKLKVDEMKKTLLKHFSKREKDKRFIMTMKSINYI